ncbi:hypothetical protein Vqi01_46900 [Micromonospora qiuiae]|uniref:LysM domain-containing protein n=1 Tax=Micromonospora qiuiae TaxID=502268 RepID=A0ABQ4JGA3_9ACTN|nr:LysM peptidoglycan-binding domain-containing protein [Micromonospora qiuiae]GIJ29528.1 hypothetical protein Vqi01_46900 [Micromonospora qiuiae]
MAASGGTAARRAGRVLTGFGALIVLVGLLAGGPIALLALAGNPLPDHVPTLAEIGTVLTSRDDGQLFLRALALAGWFGWATFALSVLVEVGAQALRRPAPRLPGMSRQQRAAAALVGSVALILVASPAATAATTAYTAGTYATPAYAAAPASATAPVSAPTSAATFASATAPTSAADSVAAPASAVDFAAAPASAVDFAAAAPPVTTTAVPGIAASTAAGPATAARDDGSTTAGAAVYRVAKGDYLGKVAERYLDDFEDYRELAALNRLRDPDRIRPGQLIKLPSEAADQGSRPHATGRLVTRAASPSPGSAAPERTEGRQHVPSPDGTAQPDGATQHPDGATQHPDGTGKLTPVAPAPTGGEHAPPRHDVSGGHPPVLTVGAASASEPDRVNRPLAVSAVLAVASIVGAQIGAVLGMRRRAAVARATGGQRVPIRPPSGLPAGRHRRD